jgi:hypothetical protein
MFAELQARFAPLREELWRLMQAGQKAPEEDSGETPQHLMHEFRTPL